MGTFELDEPIVDYEENIEVIRPLHYWVEVDKKILDVTAKQFQNFVYEEIPDIIYGDYSELPRYHKKRIWK